MQRFGEVEVEDIHKELWGFNFCLFCFLFKWNLNKYVPFGASSIHTFFHPVDAV